MKVHERTVSGLSISSRQMRCVLADQVSHPNLSHMLRIHIVTAHEIEIATRVMCARGIDIGHHVEGSCSESSYATRAQADV